MPDQRDVSLEGYSLSRYAYRELKYFCLQYGEKKRRAANARYARAPNADRLTGDCELIEQTALEAAGGVMYPYLMKNITQGAPFECLGIPCGENQFYELRKHFYFLLAQKRMQGKS